MWMPYINVNEFGYVKCSGDGLTHAIANEKAEFEVDTTKAGLGTLGLAMEGPADVTDITFIPGDENGKFSIDYIAPLPGVYKITVKFNDEDVPGAPFEVTVRSGSQIDWQMATYQDDIKLEHAFVGVDNFIDVYTDRAVPNVKVEFSGPLLSFSVKYRVIKVDINRFRIHFTPRSAGVYKLDVSFGGLPVKNITRKILAINKVSHFDNTAK